MPSYAAPDFLQGSWRGIVVMAPLAVSLARQQRVCRTPAVDLTIITFVARCSSAACVCWRLSVLWWIRSPPGASHCSPRALLAICRSFLRGSIRCLAIATPIAPSVQVAISSQHFSPTPRRSHCTFTATRTALAIVRVPSVASQPTVAARRT